MRVESEKMAEHCIKAALGAVALFTLAFWGDWWFILFAWMMVYPIAILLSFVLGHILYALGATIEKQSLWLGDDVKVIDKSTDIVGRWNGAEIHEWVTIDRPDGGGHIKLQYKTIVDLSQEWEAPNKLWFVVIDGGILYVEDALAKAGEAVAAAVQAAHPENTAPPAPPAA